MLIIFKGIMVGGNIFEVGLCFFQQESFFKEGQVLVIFGLKICLFLVARLILLG